MNPAPPVTRTFTAPPRRRTARPGAWARAAHPPARYGVTLGGVALCGVTPCGGTPGRGTLGAASRGLSNRSGGRAAAARTSRADLDLAVVAEHEAVGAGRAGRAGDLHVVADEGRLDAGDAGDRRAGEHDRVLDLAVDHRAARGDRGERADVAAGDPRAGADDHGADDAGPLDHRALLHHHPADQLAGVVDPAGHPGLERLEHEPVHLEHVGDVAGV